MALTISHAVGPTDPPLRDITLGALLAWAAETTPDRVALIFGTPDPAQRRQWTYAQLHAESQRTARALLTRFQPGERVAVWSANRPEWVMLERGVERDASGVGRALDEIAMRGFWRHYRSLMTNGAAAR